MSNLNTLQNEEVRPEMDNLLHDYFKAEMPHPWPTFKDPSPLRTKQTASSWSRNAGRVVLATSIACLVAGYLMLGAFFPRPQTPTGVEKAADDIGQSQKKTKTPSLPK